MNVMKKIVVEKITLNIGVGSPGDKLEKAMKLLKSITGFKPVTTKSNKRIPTWGVRPGLQLGCKITIRGKKANILLARLLQAVDNKLLQSKFDKFGNFSFGIPEYIDIPDVSYDPTIGVIGLEAAVSLKRSGFRIKRRTLYTKKIPMRHKITAEESMEFIKSNFNVQLVGEEE